MFCRNVNGIVSRALCREVYDNIINLTTKDMIYDPINTTLCPYLGESTTRSSTVPLLVSTSIGQLAQSEDMLYSLLLVLDWLTGVTPFTGRLQSGFHGDQELKVKSRCEYKGNVSYSWSLSHNCNISISYVHKPCRENFDIEFRNLGRYVAYTINSIEILIIL